MIGSVRGRILPCTVPAPDIWTDKTESKDIYGVVLISGRGVWAMNERTKISDAFGRNKVSWSVSRFDAI